MPDFYISKAKNVQIGIVVKFKLRRISVITSKIVNNPNKEKYFL